MVESEMMTLTAPEVVQRVFEDGSTRSRMMIRCNERRMESALVRGGRGKKKQVGG